jgi:KTSC domain
VDRIQVSSSNLASVGYDPAALVLEVEFNNGSVYQYAGVPESVYSRLMAAGSKGTFFDQHVKKAGYSYQQIR